MSVVRTYTYLRCARQAISCREYNCLFPCEALNVLQKGHAYHCFCSPTRLEELKGKLKAAGATPVYDRKCLKLSAAEVEERHAHGEKSVVRFQVHLRDDCYSTC